MYISWDVYVTWDSEDTWTGGYGCLQYTSYLSWDIPWDPKVYPKISMSRILRNLGLYGHVSVSLDMGACYLNITGSYAPACELGSQ